MSPVVYPQTLPPLPPDGWNCAWLHERNITDELPDDWFRVTAFHRVDAPDGPTAELRVMAYMDRNYEDDLRGAEFTAVAEVSPGRWEVRVLHPRNY